MKSFIRHAIKRVYFTVSHCIPFISWQWRNLWFCSCWNTKRCEIVFFSTYFPYNFSLLFRHFLARYKVFFFSAALAPSCIKKGRMLRTKLKRFEKLEINKQNLKSWSYLHYCRMNWQLQLTMKWKLWKLHSEIMTGVYCMKFILKMQNSTIFVMKYKTKNEQWAAILFYNSFSRQ